MDAFEQWLFDTVTHPNGHTDWVMMGTLLFLVLICLGLLAGLLYFIRDACNTSGLPTVRKTGRVLDHAYTPAESGMRWEIEPTNANNMGSGIYLGLHTMVAVPYHNPERYLVLAEVERKKYWMSVSPVDYEHLQKNDEVDVLGVIGRFSRRFEAQSVSRRR